MQHHVEVRIGPPFRQVHLHVLKVKPRAPANVVALSSDEGGSPDVFDHPELAEVAVIFNVGLEGVIVILFLLFEALFQGVIKLCDELVLVVEVRRRVVIEVDLTDLHSVIANNAVELIFFSGSAGGLPEIVFPVGCSVAVCGQLSERTVQIPEDASKGILEADSSWYGGVVEIELLCRDRSCSHVSRSWMPTVRAVTEGGCRAEVQVFKACAFNAEPFRPRTDNSTECGVAVGLCVS